jgi:uroporphyrinogen decarboxylase
MFGPCRDAGIPVVFHSDGKILEIIPDLIEVGVRVLNPQCRANGLEGLARVARGKVALSQDLDRQLFPFATASEIQEHVGQVHEALVLPEGGLMLQAEISPDVPLANIDALCTALERVCRLPDPE